MEYKKPKGTRDHFDLTAEIIEKIIDVFTNISQQYGYKRLLLPSFEMADLYKRQMPTADVVIKELYEFFDKKNRHLALRPEFTAGVVRAVIENRYYACLPLRICYSGSVFRYERPQNNRYREFFQFGCELFGDNSSMAEWEIVQICQSGLQELGISNFKLYINDIGNAESRKKWINALRKYFQNYVNQLTDLSKGRIATNPLRILDDKVDGKKIFVKQAPQINQFLSENEKKSFMNIQQLLNSAGISFIVNANLVRGLDYYTNFVFEFVKCANKSQDTLIAGGRYNDLTQEIGGVSLPAIGFSAGIDRLADEYVQNQKNINQIGSHLKIHAVVGLSSWNDDKIKLIKFANLLRSQSLKVITTSCKNFRQNVNLTKRLKINYYIECVNDDNFENAFFDVYDVQNRHKLIQLNYQCLLKLLWK